MHSAQFFVMFVKGVLERVDHKTPKESEVTYDDGKAG
jgi:hypothetical protein